MQVRISPFKNFYLQEDVILDENFCFSLPNKNLIVFGDIISDSNLVFKVNNLIVVGNVITVKKLMIEADNLYVFGKIKAKTITPKIKDSIYFAPTNEAVRKISELGIDIQKTNGKATITV